MKRKYWNIIIIGYLIGSLWGFGHYWNHSKSDEVDKSFCSLFVAVFWPWYAASVIMQPQPLD